MADVFISYKREDREHAERLWKALEGLGFDVWYDFELLSGDPFRSVIRRIIEQCSAAVVIWSHRSIASEFVLDEATHAKTLGRLCPVRIDNVALPFGFGQTHTENLTDWDGRVDHEQFQKLVRSIESKVGRHAGAPRPISDQSRLETLEFDSFTRAQAEHSDAALRAFIARFPNGTFSTIVRDQLQENNKIVNRFWRLPFGARLAVMITPIILAGGWVNHRIDTSLEDGLTVVGGNISEPLAEAKLADLVRRAVELVGKGECSPQLMEPMLLSACQTQIASMQNSVAILGPIAQVKSLGRKRSAASGGAQRTQFQVKFEKGEQTWEALGGQSGKLVTFWTSGM